LAGFIYNGRYYDSIWKKKSPEVEMRAEKESSQNKQENRNVARHRQAYSDPTASTAINNVLREERRANKKKRRHQQPDENRSGKNGNSKTL